MKKRDWTLIVALCGVLAVVLVAGEMKTKQQEKLQYQNYLAYGKHQVTPTRHSKTHTKSVSLDEMDTLDYLSTVAKRTAPHIVAIGSSATEGVGATDPSKRWFNLLAADLKQKPGLSHLAATDLATAGTTTTLLLSGTQISQAEKDQPNVVLVETCALTDWYQGVPIKKSEANLNTIVSKLHMALPKSQIVLYSPNPIVDRTNSQNLTYAGYLSGEKSEAAAHQWDYIDVNSEMMSTVKAGTVQLSQLTTQAYYPSDIGNQLWAKDMVKGLQADGQQALG